MAPLPDVPDAVRIRLQFTLSDKAAQGLRFFFGYESGPPTVAQLEVIAGDIDTLASTYLVPNMHDSCAYNGCIIEDLSSSSGAVYQSSVSDTGSLSASPLPAGTAFVMSYEIANRYRGGHGRGYWPLGDAADLSGNMTFTDASVTTLGTAISDFLAGIEGLSSGGFTLTGQLIVSYYKGFTNIQNPITGRYRNVPTLRETPVVYTVQSLVARNYVGSQRRRRTKTSTA